MLGMGAQTSQKKIKERPSGAMGQGTLAHLLLPTAAAFAGHGPLLRIAELHSAPPRPCSLLLLLHQLHLRTLQLCRTAEIHGDARIPFTSNLLIQRLTVVTPGLRTDGLFFSSLPGDGIRFHLESSSIP